MRYAKWLMSTLACSISLTLFRCRCLCICSMHNCTEPHWTNQTDFNLLVCKNLITKQIFKHTLSVLCMDVYFFFGYVFVCKMLCATKFRAIFFTLPMAILFNLMSFDWTFVHIFYLFNAFTSIENWTEVLLLLLLLSLSLTQFNNLHSH